MYLCRYRPFAFFRYALRAFRSLRVGNFSIRRAIERSIRPVRPLIHLIVLEKRIALSFPLSFNPIPTNGLSHHYPVKLSSSLTPEAQRDIEVGNLGAQCSFRLAPCGFHFSLPLSLSLFPPLSSRILSVCRREISNRKDHI